MAPVHVPSIPLHVNVENSSGEPRLSVNSAGSDDFACKTDLYSGFHKWKTSSYR